MPMSEEWEYSREEDQFSDWLHDNRSGLEQDYLSTLPPEDVPLDDELSDFFESDNDDFNEYCRKQFTERDRP